MLFVFALGLGGSLALHPLEEKGATFARRYTHLVREPYQDLSILFAFSLCAIALIWVVSGWSLRHLANASREAARVGRNNPRARISTRRLPTEVRPMVKAVNAALDRLAEAYAAERRFVADAAHELRTPLAVLSLRLQRSRTEPAPDWAAIDRDLAQVGRLVNQLLELARAEHAAQAGAGAQDPVSISRLAREAAAAVLPLVEKAGRQIEVDAPERLPVNGRPEDLRDMIRNLLDNALLHGRGLIRLSTRRETGADGENAVLTVSDEGEGVSLALQSMVFERFRKEKPSSPGSGLGLSIARRVVETNGGLIGFADQKGSTIRVVLPLADRRRADDDEAPRD